MKPGPVIAMVALLLVGVWLVLQPTLDQGRRIDPDATLLSVRIGARELRVERRQSQGDTQYHFLGDAPLEALGWIGSMGYELALDREVRAWQARPAIERGTLGFFNITNWANLAWVAVGLGGQVAFFGRMLIQWVVSEKQRQSVVPELFWWLSFFGGLSLFTYFVWRTDIVGVLGQSTGIVVYARNLRLIGKQKRRDRRKADSQAQTQPTPPTPPTQLAPQTPPPHGGAREEPSHAGLPG